MPAIEDARDRSRWESAIDCAQLGVWDADLVHDTCYYSASWKRMLGYDEHELVDIGDLWLEFIHPDDREKAVDSGNQHLAGQTQLIETEFRLRHRDGRWIWVLDRGQVVERDPEGRPLRMIGVQTDITAQKELARLDGLTRLLNRATFDEILANMLRSQGPAGAHALFYIDLDRFKFVNDTIGHAAGDALLKIVATTMVSLLPAGSVVARLGGDEFAAIVAVVDHEDAQRIASNLVAEIRTKPLHWAGRTYDVGASVGIAMFADVGADPLAALSCADAACYTAKSLGRNRAVLYDSVLSAMQVGFADVRAASDLVEALKDGRIVLYGQEIRALSDAFGVCRHVEVLSRLAASDGSLISPGHFIPAAERFGLMGAFDRRVIRRSCEELRAHRPAARMMTLAINLSAMSLSDPELWSFVSRTMQETGIAPSSLCFEITETAAINNFDAAGRFVREARQAGCRISLDDFGSGLSSFAYLRRFAVDCIKIDGAFVEEVGTNSFDQAICAAIATIAAELGIDVVAERIEDSTALDALRSRGIGYGQGYLLHRPEPLADLLRRREMRLIAC